MGLESLSNASLRRQPQGLQRSAIPTLASCGCCIAEALRLQGCFVFGMDDDTPEVFLKTARFAVEQHDRSTSLRRA